MTQLKTGSWNDLGTDAAKLRVAVFVEEQHVPMDMEWDEADKTALHAVAYNRLGTPLATGRLLPAATINGVNSCKLGRMAVHRVMRGSKIGKEVLSALIGAAQSRGDQEIVIHAQCSVESFYAKQGFTARGAPFDEVGIPHQEMVKIF